MAVNLPRNETYLDAPQSTIDPPLPSGHTASWMLNHVSQPADIPTVQFLPQDDAFVDAEDLQLMLEEQKEIWAEAETEGKELARIVVDSQKKLKKKDSNYEIIDTQKFTWSHVKKAIDEGAAVYREESLSGPKGFIRKGFRKLGESAPVFQKWLALLPQQSVYASPICGSFEIILTMAKRIKDIREEVFTVLATIPDDFQIIEEYLRLYPDRRHRALMVAAAELYTSIVVVLQFIVKFFAENPFKKVGRSLFQLDNYGSSLDERLKNMTACKEKFRETVKACLHSRIRKLDERQEYLIQLIEKKADNQALVMNLLLQTLESIPLGTPQTLPGSQNPDQQLAITAASSIVNTLRRDDLVTILDSLGFSLFSIDSDLALCLREASRYPSESLHQLTWIKQSPTFRTWLTEPRSRALLIESTTQSHTTSPLSSLCAEIAHLLAVVPNVIALSHFCGLHAPPLQEQYPGAQSMLISLLGQALSHLLAHMFPDIDISTSSRDALGAADQSALWKALKAVISTVPSKWTIFVFLDSIDKYETPKLRENGVQVVRRLLRLVRKYGGGGEKGVVVKLLATSPSRMRFMAPLFAEEDILSVPEVPDCGYGAVEMAELVPEI